MKQVKTDRTVSRRLWDTFTPLGKFAALAYGFRPATTSSKAPRTAQEAAGTKRRG